MSSPTTELPSSQQTQLSFELPAPPATAETPLLPARMVNEYVYCPRLAFLEWVDGEWADSGDTEQGRRAHVRVDSGGGKRCIATQSHCLQIVFSIDLPHRSGKPQSKTASRKSREAVIPKTPGLRLRRRGCRA